MERYHVMRHLIISLLLLFPFFLHAQTTKEKYDQFFALIQAQDYPAAILTGEDLLTTLEKDSSYADVAFYLANLYSGIQDYDHAIQHAETEKNIRAKIQGKTHGYYLNAVYYLGGYYSAIGNYEAAIPLYLEVYEEMKKQYQGTSNTLAMAQSLADICYNAGITNQAQTLYEDAWEIIRSTYSPDDSVYINMSYTLGDFYIQNSQLEKSIPFFIMECNRQEKKFTKKSDEYLTAINSLGEIYLTAAKYEDAEKTYTQFVDDVATFKGKKSADYATALNNLANAYEKQNKYTEAESLYLKSLSIKEKVYTKNSSFYALTLLNLGILYDYMNQFEKAEKYLDEAISIYENFVKTDNDEYATALMSISSIYVTMGENEKAIEVLQHSLEINKKNSGELSLGYASCLNNLAHVYQSIGDLKKAEKTFVETAQLYENLLGKKHTNYGTVISSIANIKIEQGNYSEATQLLLEAISIQENSVGKSNEQYIRTIQLLASCYSSTGQMKKAEELFIEAITTAEDIFGKLHPQYAVYLGNYGYFLTTKGDYHNAEEMLNTAWKIQVAAYGKEHSSNITLLTNMANLQVTQNNFKLAEEYYLQALKIAKTHFTPEQSEYSNVLNNIAILYYHLGNYDKSEQYYIEALELRKKIYGEKHAEYSTSLNNLGTLYLSKSAATTNPNDMNEWSLKAIAYFRQSMAIDSLLIGEDNPDVSAHYNNLGEAYRFRNDTSLSEKLFLQAIALEEKKWGIDCSQSATSLQNLSILYTGMKKFEKAETTALKALKAYEKTFGKNSTAPVNVISNLAFIYESMGKSEKAKENYLRSLKIHRDILEQNFSFLSESEKENYIHSISIYNDMFNTFALKSKANDQSITGIVYSNEIYNKGLLFRSSSRVKDIVLESKDVSLIATYQEWINTKQELSEIYSSTDPNRKNDLAAKEEKANELEKQLVVKSDDLKAELNKKNTDWKDIKSKLKTGQAAIEFIHFNYNDEYKQDLYCALIITSNSTYPEMTELFTDYQLDSLIGKYSGTSYESVSALYGKQKNLNVELFSLIWGYLEKSLTGINEIYYSPTGKLHKISFSALGDMNGKYISDKYTLHQVNSTANLMEKSAEKMEPNKSMVAMIGGVKYDTDNSDQHIWSYLPGTLTETEHIQSSLTKAGTKSEVFTADLATEEKLKMMDGEKSPDILHVATHGFFFGDPEEQKVQLEKQVTTVKFRGESRGVKTLVENPNPLMRSGIVLAGANDVWNETKPGINNEKEDGILTAYEVSLMNLQNTKLVVLSACETGLGDIKGAEGVYGLQRAFRIAGVDMMIMSLWQVPDKETDEFMTAFYNEWLKTKEIRKAFTNAQKMMRAKYDPYFWGAFVLIE